MSWLQYTGTKQGLENKCYYHYINYLGEKAVLHMAKADVNTGEK